MRSIVLCVMSFISVGCEKAERGPAPLPSPEQVPPAEVDAAVAPKVAQDAEVYRDPLHWGHKGKVPKGCHAAESMGQSAAPPVGFVVEFRSWAGPRGESGMRIFADGRTQRLIRGAGDDLWGAATPLSPAQLRRVKDRISSARIADLHPLYERDEIGLTEAPARC